MVEMYSEEKVYVSGFFPEVERAGSFLLEDILRISPSIFKIDNDGKVIGYLGDVVSFGKKPLLRNKYFLITTHNERVGLEFGRRDKGEKLILSIPINYGCSRDLLEEAYGGELRGKILK